MCGDTPTSRRIFDAIVADCIPLIVGTRLWGRCEAPCHEGWGWFVSGREHPHLPFRDTYVDYTRFPRVDEKLLYEDATKAYEDAVRDVTEAEERDMWRYLNSIRDDVVYRVEISTPSTRRLLDGVVLPVPHRSTEPGRPPGALELVDFHTGRLRVRLPVFIHKVRAGRGEPHGRCYVKAAASGARAASTPTRGPLAARGLREGVSILS